MGDDHTDVNSRQLTPDDIQEIDPHSRASKILRYSMRPVLPVQRHTPSKISSPHVYIQALNDRELFPHMLVNVGSSEVLKFGYSETSRVYEAFYDRIWARRTEHPSTVEEVLKHLAEVLQIRIYSHGSSEYVRCDRNNFVSLVDFLVQDVEEYWYPLFQQETRHLDKKNNVGKRFTLWVHNSKTLVLRRYGWSWDGLSQPFRLDCPDSSTAHRLLTPLQQVVSLLASKKCRYIDLSLDDWTLIRQHELFPSLRKTKVRAAAPLVGFNTEGHGTVAIKEIFVDYMIDRLKKTETTTQQRPKKRQSRIQFKNASSSSASSSLSSSSTKSTKRKRRLQKADPSCDVCHGSGQSYWMDDVYGECTSCLMYGIEPTSQHLSSQSQGQ